MKYFTTDENGVPQEADTEVDLNIEEKHLEINGNLDGGNESGDGSGRVGDYRQGGRG